MRDAMPKTRRKKNYAKHKARVRAVSRRIDAERRTKDCRAKHAADTSTDYPFTELGDVPWQPAPIREVARIVSYDSNKYCRVLIDNRELDVKAGYIYRSRPVPGVAPERVNVEALSLASRD